MLDNGQEIRFRFHEITGIQTSEVDITTTRQNTIDTQSTVAVTPLPLKLIQKASDEFRLLTALQTRVWGMRARVLLPSLAFPDATQLSGFITERIGVHWPPLPENFVAVVLRQHPAAHLFALILDNSDAQAVVDGILSRSASTANKTMSPFDRGILLQLVAMVMSDILPVENRDFEVAGILDSQMQLQMIFGGPSPGMWHVRGHIFANDRKSPWILVGVGMPFSRVKSTPRETLPAAMTALLLAPLDIEIGGTTLPANSLKRLEKGDVITLDRIHCPPCRQNRDAPFNDEIHLRNGYLTIAATWDGGGAIQLKEKTVMSDSTEQTHILHPPILQSASQVQVPCTVEIGQLRLSVNEIASLVPGQILKLNQPLTDAVYLKAGDQVICKGQLVEVENEIALEILEVP
ncbi:MAG: FliM/FliN family flagellar motor switch protein [Deltaproteobacteria bacterium]|nr:FliM/FliN family flagellar motor switch protein [Deltaproteobacteria bacterium]